MLEPVEGMTARLTKAQLTKSKTRLLSTHGMPSMECSAEGPVTLKLCSLLFIEYFNKAWHNCAAFLLVVVVLSLVSSILTLMLIACDRFFGIVFALKARLTERRSSTFIVVVWIASFIISAPLLFYRGQFTRQWLNHTEV